MCPLHPAAERFHDNVGESPVARSLGALVPLRLFDRLATDTQPGKTLGWFEDPTAGHAGLVEEAGGVAHQSESPTLAAVRHRQTPQIGAEAGHTGR
jgi:hypothetical protein